MPIAVTRTVATPGGELAVLDFGGDSNPLLLLHGGASDATTFAPLVRWLTPRFHVYALDFRGHGRSGPSSGFSLEAGVADVDAAAHTLDLGDAVLVGSSLGGMVAVATAATHGARAVVNIDGFGSGHPAQFAGIGAERVRAALDRWTDQSVAAFRSQRDHGDRAWLDTKLADAQRAAAAAGLSWTDWEPFVTAGYHPTADGWQRHPSNALNESMYRGLRELDMRPYYAALPCATLVLRAQLTVPAEATDEDKALLAAYQVGLSAELQEITQAEGSPVVCEEVPAGHLVHLVCPQWLADRVVDFAAQLPAEQL